MGDILPLVVLVAGCPFPILWESFLSHANNDELMGIQRETSSLWGPNMHVMVYRDVIVGKPRVSNTMVLEVLIVPQEAAARWTAQLLWDGGGDHGCVDLNPGRNLHECFPKSLQCILTIWVFEDVGRSTDDDAFELPHDGRL